MYIWERSDWPRFDVDLQALLPALAQVHRVRGELLGRMRGMGFEAHRRAHLSSLTDEIVRSHAIEGETLPLEQVRSSLARRMGLG
ncbi:DUF4172 domain-containing protein [Candidatus Parcubacteria bacterium]|nr:MAG: DUF4172 domain-containing protein [Candidatus Parcubacteria bacterium]